MKSLFYNEINFNSSIQLGDTRAGHWRKKIFPINNTVKFFIIKHWEKEGCRSFLFLKNISFVTEG